MYDFDWLSAFTHVIHSINEKEKYVDGELKVFMCKCISHFDTSYAHKNEWMNGYK